MTDPTLQPDAGTPLTVPGYCLPCQDRRPLVGGPLAPLAGYYCLSCASYQTLPDWAGYVRVAWIHYLQQQYGMDAALLTALPAPTQPLPVTPEEDAACRIYMFVHGLTTP